MLFVIGFGEDIVYFVNYEYLNVIVFMMCIVVCFIWVILVCGCCGVLRRVSSLV